MTTPRAATAQRRIHFYFCETGFEDDQIVPMDLKPISDYLSGVDTNDLTRAGPYHEMSDGDLLVAERCGTARFRFTRIRRSDLPTLFDSGRYSPLRVAVGGGVAESIHIRFFSKHVVGADYTLAGPRATTFAYYCAAQIRGIHDFRFAPLLNHDAARRLERFESLMSLHLRVSPSYAPVIAAMNQDLGRGISALAQAGQAEAIEVHLRPEKYARNQSLAPGMLEFSKQLAQTNLMAEQIDVFEVKGKLASGGTDVVNLLSDRFITQTTMIRQNARSRAVEQDSAFAEIEWAYNELRPELEAASSITIADAARMVGEIVSPE